MGKRRAIGLQGEIVSGLDRRLGQTTEIACASQSSGFWALLFHGEAITLPVHEDRLASLAWSPDSTLLAIGGAYGLFCRWDAQGLHRTERPEGLEKAVSDIAFHPTGRFCVAVERLGHVSWWVPRETAPRRVRLYEEIGAFNCVTFSPDGEVVFAGTTEGRILALDADTGDKLADFKVMDGELFRLAADPHRERLLAVGDSGTVAWLDFDELDRLIARRTGYWIERLREDGEPALAEAAMDWADGHPR